MYATEDEHPIEAFTAGGADEALGEYICSGSCGRGADNGDAFSHEDPVEARGALGIPGALLNCLLPLMASRTPLTEY